MSRPIKWSIPGISSIKVMRAQNITRAIAHRYLSGCVCSVDGPAFPVQFFPTPVCEIKESVSRKGHGYEIKLTFKTLDRIYWPGPLVFVIADVDGRCTLIGQREHPTPTMTVDSTTSEAGGQKCLQYEVTCKTVPIDVLDLTFASDEI